MELLAANGHRLDDILHHYTVPQIELLARLCGTRRMNEMRVAAISMRAASGADERQWRKFMRTFETDKGQKPGESPADAFVRQLRSSGLWRSLSKSQSGSG